MVENKTKVTDKSVDQHLGAIANEDQRSDCLVLLKLLSKITKKRPQMWGPSIVGFGGYHYMYASGRDGDLCVTGFATRRWPLRANRVSRSYRRQLLHEQRLDYPEAVSHDRQLRGEAV